jgi:TolB-like protein/class 3 adenylate cyclase/cytochrome c-type biogenesis protein CcmH/NrfG
LEPPAAAPRAERRLAAILAADIVGYSRMVEADEAGTLAAIRALREQGIDPLLAERKGRIVKLMGDWAIVDFASVVDAVACAVAIQRVAAELQANVAADRRIVFRIGVNLGDVVVEGDDLLGDGVNVAARLEQLCEPGGVLVSGTAYDHLQGRLGLPLEFTGEQQVKNIERPVRAYRVRFDGTVARTASSRIGRRSQRWVLTAALLLLLSFAAAIWHFWSVKPAMANPSIAVLPFDNIGGDEAAGRLADGLTEDIITDPARFRDLDVIARNSTEVYKGEPADVRQIGRDLNVRYVLEGSIQRQGDRVRATAQLIDTSSGAHVWSDRWDRQAEDVFAVQAEVSERVASTLGGYGLIAEAGRTAARRRPPENLTAYELYLLGIEAKHRMTDEGVDEAINLLKRALELDPQLARAWAAIARADMIKGDRASGGSEWYRAAAEAARSAIRLDPMDAEAHGVLGEAVGSLGDIAQAKIEVERAVQLNPNHTLVLFDYAAWASGFGEPEKGAAAADRLIRLDPEFPMSIVPAIGYAFFMTGRYEDTLRALARLPDEARGPPNFAMEAGALAALGRTDEGRTAVGRALTRFPDMSIEGLISSPAWADHERSRFTETMRKAGFPACAKPEELAKFEKPVRLPECEAERTKAASIKS